MIEQSIVRVGGFPYPRRRVNVANLLARTVAWYTEIIEPPVGCQFMTMYLWLAGAPVGGAELQTYLIGCNDVQAGEAFTASLGSAVSTQVKPVQYDNSIHFGPTFTDGTEASIRAFYRKTVIPSRFRIFFSTVTGPQTYTYSASLNFC